MGRMSSSRDASTMNTIPPHPRSGTVLAGKWQVEGLLGEGGTGTVFVARQADGVRVAIKVLHRRHLDHPGLVTRFRREGPLVNRIGHADVVRVLGDGVTDDDCPFLVTELLEGQTLEQERLLMGGRLAVSTVLEIGHRICNAVQAAHARGVLHRDIKPQNLFRTRKGELKVLDFGLGCEAEPKEPGITSLDTVLGTVGFMAPEQAQGRWDLVDEQTDVWAIGATLLKLATGLDAHDGSTPQQRLALAATTPVRRLAERAPWLDPRVAAALDRAMAFSRAERFPSAQLFGESLAQCRLSTPDARAPEPLSNGLRVASSAASAPPGPTPPTSSTVGRVPREAPKVAPLAGGLLALVVLVGGLVAWRSHAASTAATLLPSATSAPPTAPHLAGQTPSAPTRPSSEPSASPVASAPKAPPSARPAPASTLPTGPTRTARRCSDTSACMANATCDDRSGYCVCTKAPGRLPSLACDGACVPQDRDHCGGCSTKCGPAETCVDPTNGSPLMKCVACPGRYLHAGLCGERCVDLDNDATNCGRCGNDCRATEPACRGKSCTCRVGKCVAR